MVAEWICASMVCIRWVGHCGLVARQFRTEHATVNPTRAEVMPLNMKKCKDKQCPIFFYRACLSGLS